MVVSVSRRCGRQSDCIATAAYRSACGGRVRVAGGGCRVVGGGAILGCAVPTGTLNGFVGAPTPGVFGAGRTGAPPGAASGAERAVGPGLVAAMGTRPAAAAAAIAGSSIWSAAADCSGSIPGENGAGMFGRSCVIVPPGPPWLGIPLCTPGKPGDGCGRGAATVTVVAMIRIRS